MTTKIEEPKKSLFLMGKDAGKQETLAEVEKITKNWIQDVNDSEIILKIKELKERWCYRCNVRVVRGHWKRHINSKGHKQLKQKLEE